MKSELKYPVDQKYDTPEGMVWYTSYVVGGRFLRLIKKLKVVEDPEYINNTYALQFIVRVNRILQPDKWSKK